MRFGKRLKTYYSTGATLGDSTTNETQSFINESHEETCDIHIQILPIDMIRRCGRINCYMHKTSLLPTVASVVKVIRWCTNLVMFELLIQAFSYLAGFEDASLGVGDLRVGGSNLLGDRCN